MDALMRMADEAMYEAKMHNEKVTIVVSGVEDGLPRGGRTSRRGQTASCLSWIRMMLSMIGENIIPHAPRRGRCGMGCRILFAAWQAVDA